jgi:nitroimidazol reductase NimA-like FMN-containing flavoprotein (pyridoxamine 5'-phosphate oxidase superfamily)
LSAGKIFKDSELSFLKSHEVARLATATKDAVPQVTPIVYAMDGENMIIATDYGTRKLKNLKENPKASAVIDTYDPNKGIVIQGECEIFERGEEYLRLLKVLFDRFDFYRNHPWGEGESPILKIVPSKSSSWGVD